MRIAVLPAVLTAARLAPVLLAAVLLSVPAAPAGAEERTNRIEAVLQGAAEGDAAMQFRLAMWKFWALPQHRDVPGALVLFCRSAVQSYVPAQTHMGLMYWTGNGVPRDPLQAYLWFHLAASGGGVSAREYRERIARDYLDAPRIAHARRLARAWRRSPSCPVHTS